MFRPVRSSSCRSNRLNREVRRIIPVAEIDWWLAGINHEPGAAMWSRPQLGKGESRAIEPAACGTWHFPQRANDSTTGQAWRSSLEQIQRGNVNVGSRGTRSPVKQPSGAVCARQRASQPKPRCSDLRVCKAVFGCRKPSAARLRCTSPQQRIVHRRVRTRAGPGAHRAQARTRPESGRKFRSASQAQRRPGCACPDGG